MTRFRVEFESTRLGLAAARRPCLTAACTAKAHGPSGFEQRLETGQDNAPAISAVRALRRASPTIPIVVVGVTLYITSPSAHAGPRCRGNTGCGLTTSPTFPPRRE